MKIIFVILIVFISIKIEAQINFSIKSLNVSNLNMVKSENIIDEEIENGPYIAATLFFENYSNTPILLFPSKSELKVLFRYMDKQYSIEILPIQFIDNDTIRILPQQNKEVNFGVYLLLGKGILKKDKTDYTKEMLEILPTIRVSYKDQGINIKTIEILNVKVI